MAQAKPLPHLLTMHAVSGRSRPRAFTLVELLVVMAIAAILLGVVAPAVIPRLSGSELTRAGLMLSDTLSLAHQQAVKSNSEVFVIFYQLSDSGTPSWRGVQAATLNRSTSPITIVPVGKLMVLPTGTEISTGTTKAGNNFSPPLVMTKPVASGTRSVNGYGSVPWQGFRFRADGSLDRDVVPANAYLTIVSSKDNGKPSDQRNYYTIQINSVTGLVRSLRP